MAIPNGNRHQLAAQAVIWSWQETKNVTDAFDQTLEICRDMGLKNMAHDLSRHSWMAYTAMRQRSSAPPIT